jgi:hypothetical protein
MSMLNLFCQLSLTVRQKFTSSTYAHVAARPILISASYDMFCHGFREPTKTPFAYIVLQRKKRQDGRYRRLAKKIQQRRKPDGSQRTRNSTIFRNGQLANPFRQDRFRCCEDALKQIS